jgi:hypothetical protein
MRIRKAAAIFAFAASTTGVGFAIATATAAHAQGDAPLVYICPGVQNGKTPSCTNGQEFEVFDTNGAPIYSVGEFGGDAVFGDNRSVYPPGTVTDPALVESYTTPARYGKTTCTAPSTWIEPHGIWYCTSSGKWVKYLSIP